MYRNWKKTAALGLAVLIGCMMPMGTMLAAEDNAKTETSSVSDNDALRDDGNTPDNEMISGDRDTLDNDDTGDVPEDENSTDEVNADDGAGGDTIIADDAGNDDVTAPAVRQKASPRAAEVPGSADPKITIKWEGTERVDTLGGKIVYQYTNKSDQAFDVSVSQSDSAVKLYYCLDKVTGIEETAKTEGDMDSLSWNEAQLPIMSVPIPGNDGGYVLYVKAVKKAEEGNEQIVYARSGGIMIDTQKPEIVGIVDGETYSAGTKFQVKDANLEKVTVNEVLASPQGEDYQIVANGTSCVIKAEDMAGNNVTCSITVFGKETLEGGVISRSGVYTLQANTEYQLAAGKWKVAGDRSVYPGGNKFYVNTNSDYLFIKY